MSERIDGFIQALESALSTTSVNLSAARETVAKFEAEICKLRDDLETVKGLKKVVPVETSTEDLA